MQKICDTCRYFPGCLYSDVMLSPDHKDVECEGWAPKPGCDLEEMKDGPFWRPESPEWIEFWLTRYSPCELKKLLTALEIVGPGGE